VGPGGGSALCLSETPGPFTSPHQRRQFCPSPLLGRGWAQPTGSPRILVVAASFRPSDAPQPRRGGHVACAHPRVVAGPSMASSEPLSPRQSLHTRACRPRCRGLCTGVGPQGGHSMHSGGALRTACTAVKGPCPLPKRCTIPFFNLIWCSRACVRPFTTLHPVVLAMHSLRRGGHVACAHPRVVGVPSATSSEPVSPRHKLCRSTLCAQTQWCADCCAASDHCMRASP
jgi:hypothetical protein